VYRAMVRAKVAGLRSSQCADGTPEHREAVAELVSHIELAHAYLQKDGRGPLIITHGLSGSGKSWLSQRLLQVLRAVRVRSDVERQRLVQIGELDAQRLYSSTGINRTYEALAARARMIVECGYPAIVDATFLKRHHRLRFLELAREIGVPFVILSLHGRAGILEARIAERQAQASDASEAGVDVLRRQRQDMEELTREESALTMVLDSEAEPDLKALAQTILRGPPAPWMRRLDGGIDDEH